MANVIRLKRASGSDPAASDLVSGEPAVRTDTGELFFKKDDGSIAKVAGAGGGPDFKYLALRNAANNGAASFPNADFTLVTSGTTSAITPTAANTLLVSVNGVIQKPNTGTSTPSQGFALSGSTIKFGANISAAPDFILYQESGGIGEPSDDTVSEVKLKVSNSPVNGYFLSAQSGNNGGLTWAAPVATSCTGNSATATALATARTINGTSFDGTANITVTAAAGTLTGNTLNSSVTASSLTSLGDLAGLTVDGDMSLTGANYNVLWDKSDNALEFADNAKAVFGTGSDLQIFHDGSHSYVKTSTGDLRLESTSDDIKLLAQDDVVIRDDTDTITMAQFIQGGAVELYHNNTKRFETSSAGVSVTGTITSTGTANVADGHVQCQLDSGNGRLKLLNASDAITVDIQGSAGNVNIVDNGKFQAGSSNDLQIYHDGTHSRLNSATGMFNIQSDDFRVTDAANSLTAFKIDPDGATDLRYNGSVKLQTTSSGSTVSGNLLLDAANAEINLKAGVGTNSGAINWTFNTDDTNYGFINLPYDTRATDGLVVNGGSYSVSIKHGSEYLGKFIADGAVELYHNNVKKFETVAGGVKTNDNNYMGFGNSNDLQIYHDGVGSIIQNDTGPMIIRGSGSNVDIRNSNDEIMIRCNGGAGLDLRHGGTPKLEITSVGITSLDTLISSGEIRPGSDNDHSIGRSNRRYITYFGVNSPVNTSDKNEKNTIIDSDLGLDFINELKPISYKWNKDDGKTHYGLIAQDLEETLTSLGKTIADFGGIYKEDDSPMGLGYSELIAPIIKAVQELTAKVEALEAK